MNHEPTPCESRAEAISLLAAGCLELQDESTLRQHLLQCVTCRQRFEALSAVCTNLRAAPPTLSTNRVSDLVSRVMAEAVAGNAPRRAEMTVRQNRSRSSTTWWLVASGLGALAVAGGIAWRSWNVSAPLRDSIAHDVPQRSMPDESPRIEVANAPAAASHGATLFELRQALAHSEEEMHTLLARNDHVMFTQPFNAQSLLLESN